jgi:hypothetical protein
MRGLIFGDHRNRGGRRGPIEPVAEANLDLVFRQIVPHGEEATRGEHSVEVLNGKSVVWPKFE